MLVPRLCLAAVLAASLLRAQELPDGGGKDTVEKACSICHPASMVVGRHLTRDEWSAEVSKMVQEGAKLTDAEFTQVVDYLAKSFPPSTTAAGPADMQVIDPVAANRGRTVYIAECVTCHGPKARGASDGVPKPQRGSDLVRSVTVLHDRLGNTIGAFLKKGHPMQSGRPSAGLTEQQIVGLSHFLHQKVADTLR